MKSREMNDTARVVVSVFCGVFILFALDTVVAPYLGRTVPPEIKGYMDRVMGFLEGVLATTGFLALGKRGDDHDDEKQSPKKP